MSRTRCGVALIAAVIATLLITDVAATARPHPSPLTVSVAAPAPTPTFGATAAHVDVETTLTTAPGTVAAPLASTPTIARTAPSTARTAPTPATAPKSPTAATPAGLPAGGTHHDQPVGPGGIGSAADLGPGPIVVTNPAPCTPSSQPTAPYALAVAELTLGCVRALAPAGTPVSRDVSWNPSGTWLVATVNFRVVRLARDGTWRQDLGGGGQADDVVVSPDGTRMAIVGNIPYGHLDEKRVVVVAAGDGTGARVIEIRLSSAPSWSPDSQLLAFVSNAGGAGVPDVIHLVGADGVEHAQRSFANREYSNVAMTTTTYAPLGRPTFLPDGRIFEAAAVEIPHSAGGLWLDRSLGEVDGPAAPTDVRFVPGVSAQTDGTAVVYTAANASPPPYSSIRRFDLRSGLSVTVAAASAMPASAHKSNAVSFAPLDAPGVPQGLSVIDHAGAVSRVWRATGFNCACDSGQPAWTADDAAVAVALGVHPG